MPAVDLGERKVETPVPVESPPADEHKVELENKTAGKVTVLWSEKSCILDAGKTCELALSADARCEASATGFVSRSLDVGSAVKHAGKGQTAHLAVHLDAEKPVGKVKVQGLQRRAGQKALSRALAMTRHGRRLPGGRSAVHRFAWRLLPRPNLRTRCLRLSRRRSTDTATGGLEFDGDVARLLMSVREDEPLVPGYVLKLNSYDLGVDIELCDAVQRLRFGHPEVRTVVVELGPRSHLLRRCQHPHAGAVVPRL